MLTRRQLLPVVSRCVRARGWIIFASLSLLSLRAADGPEAKPKPPSQAGNPSTNLPVRQIGPGLFVLGQVQIDKLGRTVSFPAVVNLREGHIEYLVVASTGKTHESLLRTEAQPYHIQLALLLLGASGTTNALPEDPAKPIAGTKVLVELGWKTGGKLERFRGENFVHDRRTGAAMANGLWVYTGSRLREDGFAAQLDGSIVSLIADADALVNNPRPGREDDDNWLVRTNNLPPLNAPVEVSIRLGGAEVK